MIDKLTKADIARRNGALSRGPKTLEGKAISSRNGFKHGLTAKNFLATPADLEAFRQHLDALVEFWNPQCSYEHYLVTKLARAEFQHDRAERLQHSMIDLETEIVGPEIECAFDSMDETGALIIGYKSLDEHSAAHRNMDRHLARLSRERLRAKEAIQDAQARRANDEKLNFHVEPTDTNSEAAETTEAVPQDQDPLCPAA